MAPRKQAVTLNDATSKDKAIRTTGGTISPSAWAAASVQPPQQHKS